MTQHMKILHRFTVPDLRLRIHNEPAVDPEITGKAFDGMGKYLSWDGDTLWFTTGREIIGATAQH